VVLLVFEYFFQKSYLHPGGGGGGGILKGGKVGWMTSCCTLSYVSNVKT